MKATPILPGRSYRVWFRRQTLVVNACNPCEALCIALEIFGGEA